MTGHPEIGHAKCGHGKYRMGCDSLNGLISRADARCEICRRRGQDTWGGQLVIDHDHDRGWWAVRGLLCLSCNTRIAYPEALTDPDRVAEYLARPWIDELNGSRLVNPDEPGVGTRVCTGRFWFTRTDDGWVTSSRVYSSLPKTWRFITNRWSPHQIAITSTA